MRIQQQIGDADSGRTNRVTPPQQSAQPREQLRYGKWFGQIIIRTTIQPGYPILHRVASCQHDHRYSNAGSTQVSADLEAVATGNHHIENHSVVIINRQLVDGLVAITGDISRKGLLTQTLRDKTSDAPIIFYKQDPHKIDKKVSSTCGSWWVNKRLKIPGQHSSVGVCPRVIERSDARKELGSHQVVVLFFIQSVQRR